MKHTFCLLLAFCAIAFTASATPYVISDPYPGNNGDVIGDLSKFDIRQISFLQLDANLIRAEIDLNYDEGDITLAQFSVGGQELNPGDLLFKVGSQYKYGVAVQTHRNSPNAASLYHAGGLNILAGALYQINTGGSLTASDVLGNSCPGCTYRPDEKVWLWNASTGPATVTLLHAPVANPVSVTHVAGNAPEIKINVAFVPDSTFLTALLSGNMSVHFASATCANDTIDGRLVVPEPATWLTIGAGLLGLGFLRRRRAGAGPKSGTQAARRVSQ